MTVRIPVPESYGSGTVNLAGRKDSALAKDAAHIRLDDRDHARNLRVRSDADGRYVGTGDERIARAVADFLGVDLPAAHPANASGSESEGDGGSDTDSDSGTEDESEEMQDRDKAQLLQEGVCPWCDDYDGDNPEQHAAQAHPDEWTAYSNTED